MHEGLDLARSSHGYSGLWTLAPQYGCGKPRVSWCGMVRHGSEQDVCMASLLVVVVVVVMVVVVVVMMVIQVAGFVMGA